MTPATIDEIIKTRRILITCGTGGVGKTTVSAALAMRAATLGKKAVVITIDPAKRLATSLGLDTLGDHATDLTARLKTASQGEISGTFSAIMPDTRRTFESFVTSLSPSPAVAERVLLNPIFQIFAKEFSGTNEYMALERLYELDQTHKYDCIILDTPPSRNTLDFLDAPKLLARFFDERLIRWLVLPANKIVSIGMRKALQLLEKLTGASFMTNLLDFASALFEVRLAFTANLKKITELMESPSVGFLMVAGPSPDAAPDLKYFTQSLKEHKFRFDGIVLNRTLSHLPLVRTASDQVNSEMKAALDIIGALREKESLAIRELIAPPVATLPELARDVHSVEDLYYVAMALAHNSAGS